MNRLFYKIKKVLKINKIVMENDDYDFFIEEFLNAMNNPNMCMILIENMCLISLMNSLSLVFLKINCLILFFL